MLRDRLGVSERRACRIAGQHRSTQRYRPMTAADDAALRAELRMIAAKAAAVGLPARTRTAAGAGLERESQARAAPVARGRAARPGPATQASAPRRLDRRRRPA